MTIVDLCCPESGSTARIAVHRGFNCFEFLAKVDNGATVDVLCATEDFASGGQAATHYGNPLLFPYPNRIAGGTFSWEGQTYQLSPDHVLFDNSGHAIHGLCLDRPWRVINQTANSVTGAFRLSIDAPDRLKFWPTDAEIQVLYEVNGSRLHSAIRVLNTTDKNMPWGFGTHAYFRVPLSSASTAEQCTLTVPAKRVWRLNDECLPTGEKQAPAENSVLQFGRSFRNLKVDDIYTDIVLQDDLVVCRIVDPAAGLVVEQRCPSEFRELVVFTPPWSSSVCMEPYTCITDAIHLQQAGIDSGLQVLAPHSEWNSWIDIEARRLTSE